MPADTLFALFLFVLVMVGTPGPANMMLMASGAAVGLRRSMPFLLGCSVGFQAVLLAVALGLGGLFQAYPVVHTAVQVISAAYILYLAWKIATAPPVSAQDAPPVLRFREGVIVHPLNPKAWAMALVAFAQFVEPAAPLATQWAVMALCFLLPGMALNALWCAGGGLLQTLVRTPRAHRRLTITLAALTVGVVGWLVLPDLLRAVGMG